jgi:tRNA(Ile)-lysidine synthase
VSPTDRLVAALRPVLDAAPPGPVGVAVSGGGDSVALLLLTRAWADTVGRDIAAVTVDHGLREGSAGEAAAVAKSCAARGIAHEIRSWGGWDGRGNLQDRARAARRRLIAAWARERGVAAVALGHTLEDQAETFLLRLARGSGVDGLSAMAAAGRSEGVLWLRPMLGLERRELRAWLGTQGVAWAEDPGNADPRFERVRARAALGPLAGLGLTPARLAATAGRMARARAALEAATAQLAGRCLEQGAAGDLTLDPGPLSAAPLELRLRLLAGALCWVSGAPYRPRLAALEAALATVEAGRLGHGLTLHGCVLRLRRGRVAIRREPGRVAGPAPLAGRRWDGRWELCGGPPSPGLAIAALGAEGLARFPDWRAAGVARETLVTTPAIWRGDTLLAAPFVRPAPGLAFRRISAVPPPWAPADIALNPGHQALC